MNASSFSWMAPGARVVSFPRYLWISRNWRKNNFSCDGLSCFCCRCCSQSCILSQYATLPPFHGRCEDEGAISGSLLTGKHHPLPGLSMPSCVSICCMTRPQSTSGEMVVGVSKRPSTQSIGELWHLSWYSPGSKVKRGACGTGRLTPPL